MEFEDIDEYIEWEARRVAAAFGVERFESISGEEWEREYKGQSGNISTWWIVDLTMLTVNHITLTYGAGSEAESVSVLGESPVRWHLEWGVTSMPSVPFRRSLAHHLTRGLYCLGIEDKDVLSQLPSLSAHERLELRLTLPREFWPKKWLDEER